MNCPDIQQKLTDRLMGEAPETDAALDRHVAECPACAGEAARLERTVGWVRANAQGEGAVLDEAHRSAIEDAARRPRRRSFVFPLAVAASFAVMALLVGRQVLGPPRDAELPDIRTAYDVEVGSKSLPPATALPKDAERGKKTIPELQAAIERDAAKKPAELMPPPPSEENLRALGYIGSGELVADGSGEGVVGGVVGGTIGGGDDWMRHVAYDLKRNLEPPNGELAPDMYFEHQGTNPFVVTEEDALSTFGLDVDTASYTVARNYLLRGALPPSSAVRVEEFVNAFPAPYRTDPEKTFAVQVAAAPNPFHSGYHLVRIGIKAREVEAQERKPAVLTFVIDVSGSMAMENRLGLVKRSLGLLMDKLDERDSIGIVVYGSSGRVLLEPTTLEHKDRIRAAIGRLVSEGSTNLEEGLDLGYAMAGRAFRKDASNRVVLCTDGVANNGVTSAEGLLKTVRRQADRGVDLMALGFGMGNYNDVLLQKLADQGNGQYAYIDDFGEARTFFLRGLTAVLEVVAREAKAQVDWSLERVQRYRLIGYEKRDIVDKDFRNDAVDAGELNSGHTVTVLYEVKLAPGEGDLGVVRVRYKDPQSKKATEDAMPIRSSALASSFEAADPTFRLAVVVARFAEHLRKSFWVKEEPLRAVLVQAEQLPESVRMQTPVTELVALIRTAVRLEAEASAR